jgi:predicted nucleic acid-binding protein
MMKYLFDSNILIYHLRGSLNQRGSDLMLAGLTGAGAYSIISKIELLGFNQTPAEAQQARLFLSGLQELELTSDIAEQTIQLRTCQEKIIPTRSIDSRPRRYVVSPPSIEIWANGRKSVETD